MDKTGLSASTLATRAGLSTSTLTRFIANESMRSLSQITLDKIAAVAGDETYDLPIILRNQTVPIRGFVGAGGMVEEYDNGDELERIPCPPGINSDGSAFEVKGDSNEPSIYNGWIVFINRCFPGVQPEYIGEMCVVKIADGNGKNSKRICLKIIQKGSKTGHYTLKGVNPSDKPIEDVVIEESCIIDAIVPRRQFNKL